MKNRYFLLAISFMFYQQIFPQPFELGWKGDPVVTDKVFLNPSKWTLNQSDLSRGDSVYLTADTALHMHWRYGSGKRPKWVQVYTRLEQPLDLSLMDIFGLDVKGINDGGPSRNVELKFEDGTTQAVYTWDNLARMYRWCDNLVILKNQFSSSGSIHWDAITVISVAITMNTSNASDTLMDHGILSLKDLKAGMVNSLIRATSPEYLDESDEIQREEIKNNAANALLNRQKASGLLVTWEPDGSSWLYGQGMALNILSEEGVWDVAGVPANSFALAARKLAHFFVQHQTPEGFWPRAWQAQTGQIMVYLEGDNTVWMGDFPWIPGSLAGYFRKSGDNTVLESLHKARNFLYSLIDTASGKVYTINAVTGSKNEVSNYEGYAASIYCLYQLGDTALAGRMVRYIMQTGWDNNLQYFREGPGSFRPVLLVNTWLSSIFIQRGYPDYAMDALSLAGKLLFTKGAGSPEGFDGIGPVAMWYEGTLSYIAAGGPQSIKLFNGIKPFINPDGTVPAYNDNLGSIAGIWAVPWSSLDATSWLYYASAQKTPFILPVVDPGIFTSFSTKELSNEREWLGFDGQYLHLHSENSELNRLDIYTLQGIKVISLPITDGCRELNFYRIIIGHELSPGLYVVVLSGKGSHFVKKIVMN